MNKRLFIFVIILMGISLAGIILLQLFWIRNAISIREEHFNKSVNLALRETAEKLESYENMAIIGDRISYFDQPDLLEVDIDSISDLYVFDKNNVNGSSSYSYDITAEEGSNYVISVWSESNEDKMIEYKHELRIDSLKRSVSRIKSNIAIDSLSELITHDIVFVGEEHDTIIKGLENGYLIVKKANDLNEAFIKMAYEIEADPTPIVERIDTDVLKDVLFDQMTNKGILAHFEFGIMHVDSIRSFPIISSGFDTNIIEKKYSVSVFPNELVDESNFLLVQFPGRNFHILKSMAWTLAGSLLLTLIILATFSITIFMILRQKKLSDIKSDFINNMTHEFKTPIATISLAVDSINNPKIISEEKEVRYYTDIIREENKRMNNQVESVLRMSLLDKHELEFNFIECDVHKLINIAIDKLGLLLKERKGKIIFNSQAEDHILMIDPDHFTNAILNLIDNAIKYSENDPLIEVSTENVPNGLSIKVKDDGMGMSKEEQNKIFDKFYRKTSGNIHNIKGFGLGLSYVKAIIDAFGGKIYVTSEVGKGSTFEVILHTSQRR